MNTPVHTDYTTLYGAARALQQDDLKLGLPLSRLLSLSQLLEAIVLNEATTYEMGSTPDWEPYADALRRSSLMQEGSTLRLPLAPLDLQVDKSEALTQEAIRWAVDIVSQVNMRTLLWAVHFRSGTYAGIGKIDDEKNPMVQKYLAIARDIPDLDFQKRLTTALQVLHQNDIGHLGLAVLVRLCLFRRVLVTTGLAHYHPHYSRQPLHVSTETAHAKLQAWSMEQISTLRQKVLVDTAVTASVDVLGKALSPVFLACMNKAKHPLDLLARANDLRNSPQARDYRNEVAVVWHQSRTQPEIPQEYRIRLSERIRSLNDFLFEKGQRTFYQRRWDIGPKMGIPLGWHWGWQTQRDERKQPGDKAAVFLADILRQSLGVVQAQDRISQVFGVPARYDTTVISCAVPDYATGATTPLTVP